MSSQEPSRKSRSLPVLEHVSCHVPTVAVEICRPSNHSAEPARRPSANQNGVRSQEIQQRPTPYEKLVATLSEDEQCLKELENGKRIGLYKIRSTLGSGNFSRVNMAVHCLVKERVAMKMIDKGKLDNKTQKMLAREICNMEKMHHPNIVRLYEVLETPHAYDLVMECATGGELFAKITNDGRMPEPEAKVIFAQIASAIEHLHSFSIIHRDLKAENVFYSGPNKVKLGDFGFSRYLDSMDDVLNTFCGSPPYAAPELFQDESYVGPYVDLWALGILLYFMVTAQMPFKANNVSQLKKTIINGDYTIPAYVSQSCQDLVEALLQHDPKERITLEQMKHCSWLEAQTWVEPWTRSLMATMTSTMIHGGPIHDWTDEEIETRRRLLDDYGINEKMLQEAGMSRCRHPITGIYRIVLHRIQDGRSNMVYMDEPNNNGHRMIESNRTVHKKGSIPRAPVRNVYRSKACNIL